MKVSTVAQMRLMDRKAIEVHRIPGAILMEHAGHAVFRRICDVCGSRGRRLVVLCGSGHNGGDGLVVARKLHSAGAEVRAMIVGDPAHFDADPQANFDMLKGCGVSHVIRPSMDELSAALSWCDATVDALLGTGIAREVEGHYKDVIALVNAERRKRGIVVFAVDIPSGINGDSGQVHGVAIQADHTVSFGLAKQGNLLYPGAAFGGQLAVSTISFPPELQENPDLRTWINCPAKLRARHVDGHKGSFGDALFIAGAKSYYGAPTLAALSHLRAGGGYSRLATPASVVPVAAGIASELVFTALGETATGSIAMENLEALQELAGLVDIVVVGPGLSLDEQTQKLVLELVRTIEKPIVVDGDGLSALAADLQVARERKAPLILTPHFGEMARLTGESKTELREDPVGVTRRVAQDLGATVVLKGAHSLIGLPDGAVHINTSGNSGMASAGSGDVLTGAITAAFGLGLSLDDAVRTGVFLHGLAGDLAAERLGEDGVIARELVDSLPSALMCYRDAYDELTSDCYGKLALL